MNFENGQRHSLWRHHRKSVFNTHNKKHIHSELGVLNTPIAIPTNRWAQPVKPALASTNCRKRSGDVAGFAYTLKGMSSPTTALVVPLLSDLSPGYNSNQL